MYLYLYYHVGVFNLQARRPKYKSFPSDEFRDIQNWLGSPILITCLSVCSELWLDSREEVYMLNISSQVVHKSSNKKHIKFGLNNFC